METHLQTCMTQKEMEDKCLDAKEKEKEEVCEDDNDNDKDLLSVYQETRADSRRVNTWVKKQT